MREVSTSEDEGRGGGRDQLLSSSVRASHLVPPLGEKWASVPLLLSRPNVGLVFSPPWRVGEFGMEVASHCSLEPGLPFCPSLSVCRMGLVSLPS